MFQETGTNDNNEKQQRGRIRDKTEGIGASESAAGLVRHVLLFSCLTATFHLNLPIKIQFRPFLRCRQTSNSSKSLQDVSRKEGKERAREANANTGAPRDHSRVIKSDRVISSDISSSGMSSPSGGLTDNRPHCEAATQTTSFVWGRRPRAACGLADKASPTQLLRQIFLGQGRQDGTLIHAVGHVGKKKMN